MPVTYLLNETVPAVAPFGFLIVIALSLELDVLMVEPLGARKVVLSPKVEAVQAVEPLDDRNVTVSPDLLAVTTVAPLESLRFYWLKCGTISRNEKSTTTA